MNEPERTPLLQSGMRKTLPQRPPRAVLAVAILAALLPFVLTEVFSARLYRVMDIAQYLVFHNTAEFFSVMVSLSIFGVGWYSYDQSRDRHTLFLSAAFLAIGLLDFMHTLGYSGMPPFVTANSANKSTQFWIAARLFSASVFFASAYIYPESRNSWLSKAPLMVAALAIPALVFFAITFFPFHVPHTFVEGAGLTPFKKVSEYLIMLLLLMASLAYWRRMRKTGNRVLVYYVVAFVICIFSEAVFAIYKSVFDTFNVLGHLYKVVAFFLIYQGVFTRSVRQPYLALAAANDKLRAEVAGRSQAQEHSHQSEEILKEAQRIAHLGSWHLDVATNQVVWSEELYKMYGFDPSLPPPPYTEHMKLFTAEGWERLSTALANTRETGIPYELELETVQKDGSRGWMWVRGEVVPDAIGTTVALRGVAMDITERKKLEEAVAANAKEFQLLAESMPQIVWVTRPDGWTIYLNQQWVDYTGLTLEESYGHGWNKPFHPDDQQRAWNAWQNAVTNNGGYSLECRLRRSDGVYRWWLIRGVPVRDEHGRISKWFGTCTDIEDIKLAEKELRAASLYTRTLIEASLDPLVTINPAGKITDVNSATVQATGVSRERLIGSDFSEYFTDPDKARAGYEEVFEKGLVMDYALTLRNVSGELKEVLYNASIYRNEIGEVTGVFAAARDVTERKLAEEELRAASAYARKLLEASLDPLVTIDPAGKITDVNAATVQATGVSREKLIGSDFSEYFTEPDKARAGYQEVFEKGQVTDYPLTLRNVSGQLKQVLYNASVYRNEIGEVTGIFAAARDVTARKRAEEELHKYHEHLEDLVRERTSQLEAANKELESFAYSVSHDLRTPLRAIDGFSQQVLKNYADKLDDQGKRYLNVVRDNSRKMAQLIDDILAFSRMGRLEIAMAEVNMEALAREVFEEHKPGFAGRDVSMEIKSLPPCRGDLAMLRQVWVNLLGNALKFTKYKTAAQVEVGGYSEGTENIYYVRDNGAGYDMQYADKLFGVFQRLHGNEEFEGTGIGLAIVKRIVTRHSGQVWAEGMVGEGATFYFALPLRP